jgi:hypothetical protein
VWVHALLIYVAALAMYRKIAAAGHSDPAEATTWLAPRMQLLADSIPILHGMLEPVVGADTALGAALDHAVRSLEEGVARRPITASSRPGRRPPAQEAATGRGVVLHQWPMLQHFTEADDPASAYLRVSWAAVPDEALTDEGLADATYALDEANVVFLKALVDGRPEIVTIEMGRGELLDARRLAMRPTTICAYASDDRVGGWTERSPREIEILAPLRQLRIVSHAAM